MGKSNINKVSSPRNVVGDLRLIKSLYKKVFSLFNATKSAEDSPQRHWAMTSLFNYGFTLIELLVVVLIIGILAAIALPQYQKAVDKSRMTQALIWAKSIAEAERIYHLANGKYTQNLEELDIAFPGCAQDSTNTSRYNCDDGWSIRLTENNTAYIFLPTKWLPAETTASIEYYFDYDSYYKDYVRLCYATSDRFRNVCKNMGGVKHSGTDYFRL